MRLLILGITLILISSCGHQKIRFTKMPQVIDVSVNEIENSHNEEVATLRETQIITSNPEKAIRVTDTKILDLEFIPEELVDLPETVQDSTELTDTEKQIIEWQALKAEHHAKRSALNSAIFIPTIIVGGLFTLLTNSLIPLLVGLIIALSLLVLGIVYYKRSAGSRYITPKGEKFLKVAIIALIVNAVAILVLTVLIII